MVACQRVVHCHGKIRYYPLVMLTLSICVRFYSADSSTVYQTMVFVFYICQIISVSEPPVIELHMCQSLKKTSS